MGYDGDFYGDSDVHEDCISADEAVSYVLENHWPEIVAAVNDSRGEDWLNRTKPCLELLSIVSQRDREEMRGVMRLRREQPDEEDPAEKHLFAIASDVSRFVEQLQPSVFALTLPGSSPSGYIGSQEPTAAQCMAQAATACGITDDLSWAGDLRTISRAFVEILTVTAEAEAPEFFLLQQITRPIQVLNSYRHKAPADYLVYWYKNEKGAKGLRFGRRPSAETNLSSIVSNWICEYLESYFPEVGFGACVECGKFFARERRDRAFCSKTCQNRVAYKRKKLLESNALAQMNISPDNPLEIVPGLWIQHPRHGIGLVQRVTNKGTVMATLLAHAPTSPDDAARYRSMLSRNITVQIRFLHGVRMFGYSDLFDGKKTENQLPTFYELKSEEALAELL